MKLHLPEREVIDGAETLWPYRQKQKDRDVNRCATKRDVEKKPYEPL